MKFKLWLCVFLFSTLIFNSCKKDFDNRRAGQVGVVINVVGVESNRDIRLQATKGGATASGSIIYSDKVSLGNGFDAIVSLSEEQLNIEQEHSSFDTIANVGIQQKRKIIAASTPIESATTFLIVFENAEGEFIESVSGTADSETIFSKAKYNTTYKWYAYSYNDDSVLSYDEEDPVISTSWNKDLLYAKGEFTTSNNSSTNTLNLVFKRMTAAIEYIVDSRGLFDAPDILEIAPVGNGVDESPHMEVVKEGTFDLKTGEYTAVNVTPSNTSMDLFGNYRKNYPSSKVDPIQKAVIHTVDTTQTISSLSLAFSNMRFLTDLGTGSSYRNDASDKATRDWQWVSNTSKSAYESTDAVVTQKFSLTGFTPFSPRVGRKYRMVITLLYPRIPLAGAEWAFANLYYDPNEHESNGKYKMRHHNENFYGVSISEPDNNSFWRWRSLTPDGATDEGDPCLLVFPHGRWKTPAGANLVALSGVTNKVNGYIDALDSPLRFIKLSSSGSPDSFLPYSADLALILPLLGVYYGNSLSFYDNTETGYATSLWWSSDKTNGLPFVMQPATLNSTSPPTFDTGGSDINNKGNIRCIRNTDYVYTVNLPSEIFAE